MIAKTHYETNSKNLKFLAKKNSDCAELTSLFTVKGFAT